MPQSKPPQIKFSEDELDKIEAALVAAKLDRKLIQRVVKALTHPGVTVRNQ